MASWEGENAKFTKAFQVDKLDIDLAEEVSRGAGNMLQFLKIRLGWYICQNCGIGYDPTKGKHVCPG